MYCNNDINIVAHSSLSMILPHELLQNALNELHKSYHLLRAVVKELNEEVYFIENAALPIIKIIYLSESELEDYYEKRLNTQLDITKNLYELHIVIDSSNTKLHIFTLTSHAISDGISLFHLHKTFWKLCENQYFQNQKHKVFQDKLSCDMDQATRNAIKDEIKYLDGLCVDHYIDKITKKIDNRNFISLPKLNKKMSSTVNAVGLIKLEIPKDQFVKIIDYTKKYKIKVNGLLGACYLKAISKIVRSDNESHAHSMLLRSSINLRKLVQPPFDQNQCNVCITGIFALIENIQDRKLSEIANMINEQIHEKINNKYALRQHSQYSKLLKQASKLPVAVQISNIGIIHTNYENFKLTPLEFDFALAHAIGTLCISVTTFNQKLICNAHFDTKHYEHEKIRSINKLAKKYLLSIAD